MRICDSKYLSEFGCTSDIVIYDWQNQSSWICVKCFCIADYTTDYVWMRGLASVVRDLIVKDFDPMSVSPTKICR